MKFNKKLIWYSLPILVGGFLIYKQFNRGKLSGQDAPPPPPPAPPIGGGSGSGSGSSTSSTYPLRRGSKNSTVGSLQTLLNTALNCKGKTLLVVDNDFGGKTEAALLELTGKKSVDSESDFNSVKTKLASVCALSSNLDWAWKLVDAAKTGQFNNLVVNKTVVFYKVVKDFRGLWIPASPARELTLAPRNYSLKDYFIWSATTDGGLRMEVWREGDAKGMWITKNGTDLKSSLSIA